MAPGSTSHIYDRKTRKEVVADEDFVSNFDRENYWEGPKTDKEGKVVVPALIPDALYRLVTLDKDNRWVTKESTVKSGETYRVGDIIIDQTRGLGHE